MNLPLSFSPIAATTSAEETEHLFQQELVRSHILNIKSRHGFGVDMNGVSLGNSSLSHLRHKSDYEIDCGEIDTQGTVIVGIGCGRSSTSSINGRNVVATDEAVVIAGRATLKHTRAADSREIVFRCTTADLEKRLEACLHRPVSGDIFYSGSVPLQQGIGANARATFLHVVNALDAQPTLLDHPLIASNYQELLLGTLLTLPHNFSDELSHSAATSPAPGSVVRAEEYIKANAGLPITITDILLQAGCSRKALFTNFRKFRGYTPGEFLASVRLELAHARLSCPTESDTVTSIAYESGFSHLGRFSSNYRKRFGVLPSETHRIALLDRTP